MLQNNQTQKLTNQTNIIELTLTGSESFYTDTSCLLTTTNYAMVMKWGSQQLRARLLPQGKDGLLWLMVSNEFKILSNSNNCACRVMSTLLPLDCGRRLRGDVIAYSVNAFHFIDNTA